MHKIWVNTTEKVASFKAVEGYELMEYENADNYWTYIRSLEINGFRFQ